MKSTYKIVINENYSFSDIKSPLVAQQRFVYWKNQKAIGMRGKELIKKVWLLKDGDLIAHWEKDEHTQSVQAG